MSKRSTFTNISPLPPGITREVVMEFLHDHKEMIDLNPLVIERHPIEPPSHCPEDEGKCIWWSMTDKITYMPGIASGDVTYTCAFNNLSNGLQTHCYAPLGTDIRDRWSLNGTLPGEPVQPTEIGVGAPLQGLYIREDIELRCNFVMSSFVKKTLKKSHSLLVERLASKAQLGSSFTVQQAEARMLTSSHDGSGGGDASSLHSGSSEKSSLASHQRYASQGYAGAANAAVPYHPSHPQHQHGKGLHPPPYGNPAGGVSDSCLVNQSQRPNSMSSGPYGHSLEWSGPMKALPSVPAPTNQPWAAQLDPRLGDPRHAAPVQLLHGGAVPNGYGVQWASNQRTAFAPYGPQAGAGSVGGRSSQTYTAELE